MVSLTLQGTLKDGFGEAVVVCDMTKLYKFPPLDSCQKRFLWTHKEVDLTPHPVVGLVLQVGDTEKFLHALGLEILHRFLEPGSMFHSRREGLRCRWRLVELELACITDSVAPPYPI